MSEEMEALLIGIDAGCLSVLDRLFAEDRLPHLESLVETGVSSSLESQIPPWTPSAWPSLYTGVNPGKHGAFGFVTYDGYDWEVVSGEDVREHRLWTLLDHGGHSSVVVNAPVTYPPSEIDGAIIPGFIGPEDPECHPPGLLEDVRAAIGEYRVYPAYARGDDTCSEAEKIAEYLELVGMRGRAFRYLADRFEPTFGFVQFQKTDTVFHEFGGDREKVRTVYEATDEAIGKILDECDPRRVFVASDHGIGPYEKTEFRVNEFLRREGYVEATGGGKGMPSWNPIRAQLRAGEDDSTWEPSFLERVAAGLGRVGLTASRVGAALDLVGLQEVAERHAPPGIARTASEQVDFPASTAYVRARTELGVRINLEGREPAGTVPPGEYDTVRAALIEALSNVTDPDGDPVFDEVVPRERYFEGPYAEDAVDIVTVPNEFDHFLSAQLLNEEFGELTEPWNHKLDGVFVASGTGIDTDADLTGAHLFDVAPTILAALGVPRTDRMDGAVLPVVDDVGKRPFPPFSAPSSPPGDDGAENGGGDGADVQERLANLGYVE